MPFRACKVVLLCIFQRTMDSFIDLAKKINAAHLNPGRLISKNIPNLITRPFQVTCEYRQIIYDQTSSPKLDKVLKKWEEEWASPAKRQQLAYIILVEPLAYQFASPIRWIETQDLLFTAFNFERLIEFGPYPTSTGMAAHNLKNSGLPWATASTARSESAARVWCRVSLVGKMPSGFNAPAINVHLAKTWGLGPARSDGVLLLAATLEPPKRLASEGRPRHGWTALCPCMPSVLVSPCRPLEQAALLEAVEVALSLTAKNSSGQAAQYKFAVQHVELFMRHLGRGSRASEIAFDKEKANTLALQARLDSVTREHGDAYLDGLQPRFDISKARPSIHPGIGFAGMRLSCSTTSSLAASPLSIAKPLLVVSSI